MEVSRRKAGTYGKSNRRTLVHDLFNVAQKEPSLYQSALPPRNIDATSSGRSTPFSEVSENAETSQQLRQELSESLHRSSTRTSPGLHSKSISPSGAASPSLFDITCSDDEEEMVQRPDTSKLKRRRLATKSSNAQIGGAPEPLRTRKSVETELSKTKTSKNGGKHGANTTLPVQKNIRASGPKKIKSNLQLRTSEDATGNSPNSEDLSSPHSQDFPSHPDSPKSVKSADSMASTRSTPKRKRDAEYDLASSLSSPSQLALSSLHLTHGQNTHARARSTSSRQSTPASRTPSRNRGRLIDRLDVPSESDTKMTDVSPRPTKSRKLTSPQKQKNIRASFEQVRKVNSPEPSPVPPKLQKSDSGRSEFAAPRLRTYGKQRSHLKAALSAHSKNGASSQHTLEDLVSQVGSLTAPDSTFDMEDDSEDDSGPKLKSIHELRHAGVANRFDRDLEALFEDIESDIKALRIQGLMSLVRKLQEKTFKAHVLTSGRLTRLMGLASPDLDMASSMVLLLAVWALAVAETATAQELSQLYGCLLNMPPGIMTENRAISKIAKDRFENLSTAMIRDLADFEQHVLKQSVKHDGQASHIIVSRVALRCLELNLRRVIALAGHLPDPPAAVFGAVRDCIKHDLDRILASGEKPELLESIRLLLSWLELTAATSGTFGGSLTTRLQVDYGNVLAEVMDWSSSEQPMLQQSCIKVVVELSNGDPTVCQRFANTPLLSAAGRVVEDYFSNLGDKARETEVNADKLNSTILSLGCLLNFADCSDKVRTRMLEASNTGASQVDKFMGIFNRFVDDVGEAMTEDSTQALGVPFGYLCLLLCTLCLDEPIRQHVSASIKGHGLSRLLLEATTCLEIMKKVDNDSFFERFNQTLDIVKQRTT